MTTDSTGRCGASMHLLLGGVRAGKSARAVTLAESQPEANVDGALLFVATAQAFDEEMRVRIANHQAERSVRWRTLEAPRAIVPLIADALASAPPGIRHIVVIDCLTLWVSNLLLSLPDGEHQEAERYVAREAAALVACMQRHAGVRWILVSNEVGLGIVPPTPLGRLYRDALGRANQIVAAASDTVELMVAGVVLALKSMPSGSDPQRA